MSIDAIEFVEESPTTLSKYYGVNPKFDQFDSPTLNNVVDKVDDNAAIIIHNEEDDQCVPESVNQELQQFIDEIMNHNAPAKSITNDELVFSILESTILPISIHHTNQQNDIDYRPNLDQSVLIPYC